MTLSFGIVVLLWRAAALTVLLLIATELRWAEKRDGETLRCLRAVMLGMAFVIVFPLMASVDHYTDLSPGFDLRPILEEWVWVAYATLTCCVLRFWLALHRWARGKTDE